MDKIKLSFFFLLVFSISQSQNIRLEGVVQDTLGKPLEMANVMAINKETKAMDGYGITNDKGRFQLNLTANSNYTLKVSYLGYKSQDVTVTTKTEAMSKVVTMKSGGIDLEGVEVVQVMPVSVRGDTIIYNSDSFTNGTERKLEDVLKKLPGVEVSKDGEITVEGKTVQKVMVEGKDFFDGDTKLASKNIPADALDKVQVLRNYNEVSNLKGLENNEENIAINIKLKEGKKNFWFGDISTSVGFSPSKADRYLVNPKLFYYSPKYSLNVIGNINNIGELPLTPRDYFKFTGGFKNMMRKGGSNFNVSSNDLGIGNLNNDQAAAIETKFGAANFSYNPKKSWTISGFGILLNNTTETQTINQIERPQDLADESQQVVSKQKNTQGLFKLSSSYVPSSKVHFDYDALLKFTDQREDQELNSTVFTDIYSTKTQKPFSVNQNINYYYTLNTKHVFAIEAQHLYQQEDPIYNANLNVLPFAAILPTYITEGATIEEQIQIRDDVTQNRFVKTNKTDLKLDYYYMLTPKSNINFTLGNTYSYQNFNSYIFQILENGTQNNLSDASTKNEVNYFFNDVFLGVHYKFIKGKFTVTPGFSIHQYQTRDEQLGYKNFMRFNRLLPDVFALYQIKKSETLTYNYAMNNNFTDITKLAEGNVFSNYNSIYRGNRFLENSLTHSHSLRYFKYNMFNFENIFGFLNYTKQIDAIKSKALLFGANQQSTSVNIDSNFADETLTGAFNYGRSFAKYYKASAGLSLNWSKFNNIRVFPDGDSNPDNNPSEIQSTESFTQNYNVKFSTNFKKIPNLSLGYTFTINDNFSDKFYTDSPTLGLEYYFLDAFSFVSDYSFFHNRNKSKTINSEYDFLSASLIYLKKGSKWEYKLSGTNLLNTTALNTNSFSQLGGSSTFSSYIVQPRYIMLGLKYNL